MTNQTSFLIIVITWSVLLVLYGFHRFQGKNRLLNQAIFISSPLSHLVTPPGSLLSKLGVLFVFMVNIITILLLALDSLTASVNQYLVLLIVNLPLWVNIAGYVLFLISTLWGFSAVIFNPNYTPLYKFPPEKFILATQGAYKTTRHPRYATEALLNISLFLLTGIWLSLLGLIGWLAIYHQAKAEEDYLRTLAPVEYGEYLQRTIMFLPVRIGKQ